MFTPITAWFGGVWAWFIKTPVAQVIVAALLWLLAWEQVKRELEKSGEKKERQKNAVTSANERAATLEARHEITLENQNASVRADEAVAALPRLDSLEQLRRHSPGVADELLGKAGSGSASGAKGS